jgi:3-methyladenine DNA glycosylase AlkC
MEPFKNLFNKEVATRISKAIKKHYPDFNSSSFLKNIDKELLPLELKDRVAFITSRLRTHLPEDPEQSIPILVKTLDKLAGFSLWPLTHYIAVYGIDHFDLSMNALKEMTKLFTSEFAVRPFFIKDQKRTLKIFKVWASDKNEHVRRLVSEGSRPLLPWGQKLHGFVLDPEVSWNLLEKLKNDPSEYVRKSVANHINDHSKNHPDYVIEKLLEWHHSKSRTPELNWVIKHASRSLIKKGNKKAFLLHGVEDLKIKVIEQKILNEKLKLGEGLNITLTLKNLSKKSGQVILDHEMHFLKANGKHGIKVFKGKKNSMAPNEVVKVEMSVPLKIVTTRVYYSGEQYWSIKINGVSEKRHSFILKA